MKRHALVLLSVMLVAGCATSRSNYYSHAGSGDYYYGAGTADVVINSPNYSYALGGYGAGFGYANSSYDGYGFPYSWWRYNSRTDWWIAPAPQWIPSPHHDADISRRNLVEQDRASRSALIRRDTVAAPRSAELVRNQTASPRSLIELRGSVDARGTRSTSSQRAARPYSVAPVRQAPMMRSLPAPSRSAGMSAPTRSAPPPSPPQRNQ